MSVDDIGGHRNVVELFGHLAAVLVGPREELECFAGRGRIRRLLVDQDPGRGRHRPGLVARLVGEDHAIARLRLPIGIGGCSLERFRGRRNRLAGLVDHFGEGQLVLLGVGILDIADRAFGVANVVGNAFITLGADSRSAIAPRC